MKNSPDTDDDSNQLIPIAELSLEEFVRLNEPPPIELLIKKDNLTPYNMPETQLDPQKEMGEVAQDAIAETVFTLRDEIREISATLGQFFGGLKSEAVTLNPEADKGEMIANAMLAYRHLEDATMRLGKVLQAKNGGVSILTR